MGDAIIENGEIKKELEEEAKQEKTATVPEEGAEELQEELTKVKKKEPPKSRVWEIQSYTKDIDGNTIFTTEMVKRYLADHEIDIVRWCWVVHNRDVFTEADWIHAAEDRRVLSAKLGDPKPEHIHLVVQYQNPVHCSAIAKDICLPVRQIQKAKAKRNQFVAIAAYFTHEDKKQRDYGKTRYTDSEIHYSKNFDFRTEVSAYFAHRKSFENAYMSKVKINELIEQVVSGQVSIRDIKQNYGFAFFLENEQKFVRAYREYIKTVYEMQPRLNIFIEGPSGRGKSSLATMLARYLYSDLTESEAYFVAGKKGVRFDDYSYQPVIVWDDVRSGEMLEDFGREGMLNLLEIHPKKVNYNIKYGGVILINQVNIFTGIETHQEFLDGLMGEYRDKSGRKHQKEAEEKSEQAYRRMAIVLSIYPEYFDIKLNQGLFSAIGSYKEFDTYARVMLDIYSMNLHYAGEAKKKMLDAALGPVKEKCREYLRTNHDEVIVSEGNAAPSVSVIMDAEELSAQESREKERYEKYLEVCTEEEQRISFEKWRLQGCPSSPVKRKVIDTYREGAIEDRETIDRKVKEDAWKEEAIGVPGMDYHSINPYFWPEEKYERYQRYYQVIIKLNYMFEELEGVYKNLVSLQERRKQTMFSEFQTYGDDTFSFKLSEKREIQEEIASALLRAKQQVDACVDYLRDKYYQYQNEKVVKRIAKIAVEMQLIDSIDDFEKYIFREIQSGNGNR